jgi:hypothetical protein
MWRIRRRSCRRLVGSWQSKYFALIYVLLLQRNIHVEHDND